MYNECYGHVLPNLLWEMLTKKNQMTAICLRQAFGSQFIAY